ncbi:MAG: hypothetical protein ACI9US_003059, partial [Gammaproteobacteria bacterium]
RPVILRGGDNKITFTKSMKDKSLDKIGNRGCKFSQRFS